MLVVIPENYVTDYAPFTVDMEGNLVKVQVKIKVIKKKIKVLKMTLRRYNT